MTDVARIIREAAADAYLIPPVGRGVYDFREGDPSVYDLRECDFRPEDRDELAAAATRAEGERRRLMLLLVEAMDGRER